MQVQLLTFPGCPNAEAARDALRRAFDLLSLEVAIEEVDLEAAATPRALRGHGSPTILIDGVAVGDGPPFAGGGCRLYHAIGGGLVGHPPVSELLAALERARALDVPRRAGPSRG